MRLKHLIIASALLFTAVLSPARSADEAAQPSNNPDTAPPDHLTDAIDPFAEGSERAKFLRAAGKDGEMDEAGFKTDQQSGKGFVRGYDTWPLLLKFDENHNKAINWLEAGKYRKAILALLLKKHDANKNSKLAGPERDQANTALARNELVRYFTDDRGGEGDALAVNRPEPPSVETPEEFRNRRRVERDRRINVEMGLPADHDGKYTDEDIATIRRTRKERWQKQYEQNLKAVLKKYDHNGNGKLDTEESEEYKRNRNSGSESAKSFFEFHAHYDRDGDGLLNGDEMEALTRDREEKTTRRAQALYEWLREPGRYRDMNADGKVDGSDLGILAKEFDSIYRDKE